MKILHNVLYKAAWSLAGKFHSELVSGPLTYNQDGLASRHNVDFIQDPEFKPAYAAGKATGSWGNRDVHWRIYTACWAARQALSVDGDFVEFGVNRGGLSRAVMEYVNFRELPRKYFLFDTFAGLDGRFLSTEESQRSDFGWGYTECFAAVKKTFSTFSNIRIVQGAVPETLSELDSEKIAFASIDMNCTAPEIAAAEKIWPLLAKGGLIILDDYGWAGHIEQKHAFDEFVRSRSHSVLSLPTGQGLIIKHNS